jgi:hypothetical protein
LKSLADIIVEMQEELRESERVRADLVEINRILTVAVQLAQESISDGDPDAYEILKRAEERVKAIATKDETNASNN